MSSEYRTTLTATSRELQDHRNLPYEAVRRAWWNGFWWSFVWIVFIGGVLTVFVLYVWVPDSDGGPAPSGNPTTAPTGPESGGVQPPPNDSVAKPPGASLPPGVNQRLPRRRPAPAKEASDLPKAPVSPTDAVGVNPLFPLVPPN